jgi:hypothetical protein
MDGRHLARRMGHQFSTYSSWKAVMDGFVSWQLFEDSTNALIELLAESWISFAVEVHKPDFRRKSGIAFALRLIDACCLCLKKACHEGSTCH